MNWTKEKPKVPGWYWVRMPAFLGKLDNAPCIIPVIKKGKTFVVNDAEQSPLVSSLEYAGPIQLPEEPASPGPLIKEDNFEAPKKKPKEPAEPPQYPEGNYASPG